MGPSPRLPQQSAADGRLRAPGAQCPGPGGWSPDRAWAGLGLPRPLACARWRHLPSRPPPRASLSPPPPPPGTPRVGSGPALLTRSHPLRQPRSEVWGSGPQPRIWGGTRLSCDVPPPAPISPRPGRGLAPHLSASVGEHAACAREHFCGGSCAPSPCRPEPPTLGPANRGPPAPGGSRLGGETPRLRSAHAPVHCLPAWPAPAGELQAQARLLLAGFSFFSPPGPSPRPAHGACGQGAAVVTSDHEGPSRRGRWQANISPSNPRPCTVGVERVPVRTARRRKGQRLAAGCGALGSEPARPSGRRRAPLVPTLPPPRQASPL